MADLPTPDEVRAIMERRHRLGPDYMSAEDFDAIVALADALAVSGDSCMLLEYHEALSDG